MRRVFLSFSLLFIIAIAARAGDGNRLAYLQDCDPYYPHTTFPKLTTPQWLGEPGVDAVIVLAIDDMRGHEKWEAYLRPILERLKKIDGRAPVSIMTCQIDPKEPHLQKWLQEGVSLETHTFDHPCPFFRIGFDKAKATYEKAVDLLNEVPNNRPCAFRMPCCDSLNTPSPRFWMEIFNKTSPGGKFLTIDSSVFNLFTPDDKELPRELVVDSGGKERFRKYLPLDGSFANTIENYPYPYVIGGLCWQFPCPTPSDWQAQHLQKPFNPITVADMKASIDCTVAKKGTFGYVFHPHGWIKNEQVIELIDHVVEKYGKRVKFLTFREAQDRLDKHLLAGHPVRHPTTGADNGVRIVDLDGDGYLDVVIANDKVQKSRVWSPKTQAWVEHELPKGTWKDSLFGVLGRDGRASIVNLQVDGEEESISHFTGDGWAADRDMGKKLPWVDLRKGTPRLRDIDGDGICEIIAESKVFRWAPDEKTFQELPFRLPATEKLPRGKDEGIRFIDLDGDGRDDVVVSNETEYGVHLFRDLKTGWSKKVLAGKAGEPGSLPPIAFNGVNNGFWVFEKQLIWGNENSAALKSHVERRAFADLLKDVQPGAKTPAQSLKLLHPRPGFVAQLTATEPLVMDPIAFNWGPDGRLWVVEMGDYPLGIDPKGTFGGNVKILADTDGDGVYDKVTVFLSGLGFPTGVLPWGKGAIVVCAPDVFYAEDTDGDGKADRKEILYTGFNPGNQQHRVNGPVRGLDNWLYLANGDSGGKIKSLKTGEVVDITGRDLRIKPETGALEAVTGQTQFGRSRDDWGNWFGGNNSNPMFHYVLDDAYLRRNPHYAPPPAKIAVSVTPGTAPVYPRSTTLTRFNDPAGANRFTSANSPIVYRDDLFGPDFANNTFVSEPVHNLVHREIMKPEGVTFTSRRAADEEKSEFLASEDNWFRPTMLQTGPDGALWVADMYRHVIEHPQWIPKDWQQKLDLRAGHDMGRLYRVYPVDKKPRPIPNLAAMTTAQLVEALKSPNGWARDTAQYLLVSQKDAAAIPLLTALVVDQQASPQARLHALCTLDGILPPDVPRNLGFEATLSVAFKDPEPAVRKHAIRIAEKRPAIQLDTAIDRIATERDPQVTQQLAYSLGGRDDALAAAALGRIAVEHGKDRFITAAVMSSINVKNLDGVLLAVLKAQPVDTPPSPIINSLIQTANAMGHKKALVEAIRAIGKTPDRAPAAWQMSALSVLLDSFDSQNMLLADFAKSGGEETRVAIRGLNPFFENARRRAADEKLPFEERVVAVRLLGRGPEQADDDLKLLGRLLSPQHREELQMAALANLSRGKQPRAMDVVLENWKGFTPSVRAQAVETILSREPWTIAMLDAVEKDRVPGSEIGAAHRQRLVEHKNPTIATRAAKVFAGGPSADRRKVVEQYREALTLKGDAVRGQALFAKTCANCHRLGNVGNEVGPDLSAVWDKSAEWLLTSILDPNLAVEARYVNYLVFLKNGRSFTGVITGVAGNSFTLVTADGKSQSLLRGDVDELASTGKSAMPEGIEKDLQPQDVADVIAHIRANAAAPKAKAFEGNIPALVRPAANNVILLPATAAEIRGSKIIFEKPYANLGYWSAEDDTATWAFIAAKPGKYAVWLDYACDNASAGNTLALAIGSSRVTGKIASTGSWDTYRMVQIGSFDLTAGEHRLVARSAGPIRGALIDLKSIKLVPQ